MSKIERLKSYLQSGSTATPRQITGMFGIANPTAAIHTLRSEGLCVYANRTTLRNGTQTTKYRVGTPTREMVRAAHALGLFN
jgi:hypothetical protein